MLLIEWSDEAQLDLVEIQSYIEQPAPQAAHDLRLAIDAGVEVLRVLHARREYP